MTLTYTPGDAHHPPRVQYDTAEATLAEIERSTREWGIDSGSARRAFQEHWRAEAFPVRGQSRTPGPL